MKVQKCSSENNNRTVKPSAGMQKSPSFKAGAFDLAGSAMQWIQDKGFLVSFLIQDGLGMTAPRVVAGFGRDKEVTGKINTQEGFEVLGREGLTGPAMMAMAPIALWGAAKFGKSTSVNSQLIKRFGNSLKEWITSSKFNQELLKDGKKLQEEFFKDNIRKLLKNTVGEEHVTEEHVAKILEELKNYINLPEASKGKMKKGKYRNNCIENIVKYINDLKYTTSSDLDMLEKVKFDGKNYSTKEVFEAMIKYSEDMLALDKDLVNLDGAAAEKLKNTLVGKRVVTNIGTIAATLGVMSVLPKIYARNSIAPGARTAMEMNAKSNSPENEENQNGEVSFKAKAPNKSILERLGEFISKNLKDSLASEVEYNGHNFTNTLMACLSVFGLLLPRGLRAVNRAQKDEDGKKDLTELYEILIRDLTSSLAVVFLVPMLTRAFVSSYENKSGFVLIEKDRNRTGWKAALDLINPYSNAHVLSNKEINSLYHNVDTKAKMLNFCDYIDKNGGNLQKILSSSDMKDKVFGEGVIQNLASMDKKQSNARIKELIKSFGDDADELIKKLMQDTIGKNNKKITNPIFSAARGLNSIPALLTTVIISPVVLGWFIPQLTYANTRRIHAKRAEERKQSQIDTAC